MKCYIPVSSGLLVKGLLFFLFFPLRVLFHDETADNNEKKLVRMLNEL